MVPSDSAASEIKIFAQPPGRSQPFSGRSLVLAEGRPMPLSRPSRQGRDKTTSSGISAGCFVKRKLSTRTVAWTANREKFYDKPHKKLAIYFLFLEEVIDPCDT